MRSSKKVVIIGGGPVGMFVALALTEPRENAGPILPGEQVYIIDRNEKKHTAGWAASAFTDPDWGVSERNDHWLHYSLGFYKRLTGYSNTGVARMPLHIYRQTHKDPERKQRNMKPKELLSGYDFGTVGRTYRINPHFFLDWQRFTLLGRGVKFYLRELQQIDQVFPWICKNEQERKDFIFVNAAGIGANRFTTDPTLLPKRGLCLRSHINQAPKAVLVIAGAQTWCVPVNDHEVRLGGTSEEGVSDLETGDAYNLIMPKVCPLLGLPPEQLVTKESLVGLRPYRPDGMRLDVEMIGGIPLINCYGHGGEGFTLGPGSGMGVAEMVRDMLAQA